MLYHTVTSQLTRARESLQKIIPIHETWTPENIIRNIILLRSQIKWKNFNLSYDALTYEKKGYFVVHFSCEEPERKSSIIIYRDKVQINAKNWSDIFLTNVIVSSLLREGKKSIFLDSLYKDFKETGEFNEQFQELCLEVMISQYFDLVNGRVPKKLLQDTKENVRLTLEHMLQVVEEIG